MPNPTFFNLPEDKQTRIMDAVWQEFSAVSYMDASINRIIQSAGISRGSFYQYFTGKADVFTYVLQTILDAGLEMFRAQLTVHSNDLFRAILGMYELILWSNQRNSKRPGLERIRTLIRLNTELDMTQFTDYLDYEACTKKMLELLNLSGYTLETTLQCQALFQMLASIGISNLMDTMRHSRHESRNRQLLEQQLELIRRGLPTLEPEQAL